VSRQPASSSLRLATIRLVFLALAHLPLGLCRALGWPVGALLWWSNGRSRRVAERNVALCLPDWSPRRRRRLVRRRMVALAQTILEVPAIWFRPTAVSLGRIRRVVGAEHLAEAAQAGQGVLLLAPHSGNWELLSLYVASHYPLTAMYLPQRDPDLDALIHQARNAHEARLVPATAAGIRALLQALRRGEFAGILPDQEPRQGGEYAPFFGRPALTMTLVPSLAARTGARVIIGSALRCRGGFELRWEPVPAAIAAADMQRALSAMNQAVERVARWDLTQYQWEYKRFKSQPDGSKLYRRGT